MTLRSGRLALAGALCASLLAAAPAGAAAPLVASGAFARTAPFIDGSIYEFECDAAAPGATSTRIDSCVVSNGVSSFGASGGTSAAEAAVADGSYIEPSYNWKLCWTASATYPDGSTKTTSGCTGSSSLASSGSSQAA
jgi:hypothetical protein